ncbi:hypothetical protein ACLOJK_015809 [Asimina triloba]
MEPVVTTAIGGAVVTSLQGVVVTQVRVAVFATIGGLVIKLVRGCNRGGFLVDRLYKELVLFCVQLLRLLGGDVVKDNIVELTYGTGRLETELPVGLTVVNVLDECGHALFRRKWETLWASPLKLGGISVVDQVGKWRDGVGDFWCNKVGEAIHWGLGECGGIIHTDISHPNALDLTRGVRIERI